LARSVGCVPFPFSNVVHTTQPIARAEQISAANVWLDLHHVGVEFSVHLDAFVPFQVI
jgi:hypothetical protein